MREVICIVINIYFALSFMRAGYAYCEWSKKEGKGWGTFINALFYGFFGFFMELYYHCCKRCGNCRHFMKGVCKRNGKKTGKYDEPCKKHKW